MTRLSICGLGVSCNEMNDTPMLLVVGHLRDYCQSLSEARYTGFGFARPLERTYRRISGPMQFLYPPRSTVLFAILNRLSTGQITQYCL